MGAGQVIQQVNVAELAQVIVMWMQRLDPSVNRRELLQRLGALFAAAATGPLFDVLDPDEQQHVLHVIEDPSGFDEPTLRYCEGMVNTLARQDNVLGPQFTLQSTIGHRQPLTSRPLYVFGFANNFLSRLPRHMAPPKRLRYFLHLHSPPSQYQPVDTSQH